ncbi:nickel-type superoxide dismutase maturation protease [Kitasatospora sp. NPDC051853]|uniref:nickel-type superoxide dismutase maturation protease n=1 Tax=Kitasatospora sp. NPDC051853 TaxID=3364058 RepID=UPI0037B3F19C
MTDRQQHDGLLPFGVVLVAGPSMRPTLRDGDRVLVRYGAAPRPGRVALFEHPRHAGLLVLKRAVERRPEGWWMLSDNPFVETDSRQYGAVPEELILGQVLCRLGWPRRQPAAAA